MYLPLQHKDRNRKVTLAKMVSFQFSEKACPKEIIKRCRDTQYSLWPPHVCTWHTDLHTHMHTPHIHEKEEKLGRREKSEGEGRQEDGMKGNEERKEEKERIMIKER